MAHSARWLAGHVSRLTTDHGTSFRRIAGTLTATWLSFAALFQATGVVFDIQLAAQARSLPDPMLTYTEMLEPIQTRVGPLERSVQLTQPIPFPGKLSAPVAKVSCVVPMRLLMKKLQKRSNELKHLLEPFNITSLEKRS